MDSSAVHSETTPAVELNAFQRVVNVFLSPKKAFESLDVNPSWLLPMLIIVAVNLVFVTAANDIIVTEALSEQEQAMTDRGMDPAQIEEQLATIESTVPYFSYGFSVAGPFIILAIVAVVFLFVGNTMLGGKSTFKKLMAITSHSWLILSLYGLIILPIVISRETLLVTFSLASLMPDDQKNTFLYQLLTKFDLFYVWWIAVFSIGLAVIYKMKTQKAATAVVVVYLIYAVVSASLSSLF